jgi:hypothetical protein
MSDKLKAAVQAERERLGTVVHLPDPEAYRRAVEGSIALGGSDPNARAPGRRRFR